MRVLASFVSFSTRTLRITEEGLDKAALLLLCKTLNLDAFIFVQIRKKYAMNVVLTEKVLAMAADEVTTEGDRIPLTNFHTWNIGVDEDEEGNDSDEVEVVEEVELEWDAASGGGGDEVGACMPCGWWQSRESVAQGVVRS